jgi:hypothetical protein
MNGRSRRQYSCAKPTRGLPELDLGGQVKTGHIVDGQNRPFLTVGRDE